MEVIAPDNIRTIQFKGNNTYAGTPVIKLGEPLNLTFDDINGDEADYYYTIEHYNFDWKPSALAKNEYLDGFDDVRIVNYENSVGTLIYYSHYTLSIPNADTRRLKVSGNYMLKIFNDDGDLVFSRKFFVYQNLATVKAEVKRSRNIQTIDKKQSLRFSIDSEQILFRNPKQNLHTLIFQNNDLNTAIYNLEPQFNIANEQVYRYDEESAFWGGNEFLFFDSKSLRAPTINISRVELDDIYQHYLYRDPYRANNVYTFNPDINGYFLVNSNQGDDPVLESEYINMHFTVKPEAELGGGELHIYGNFNNYSLDNSTRLTYDQKSGTYIGQRLFKQGFYNYKYVLLSTEGIIAPGFISGNFWQTENEYTILAYYRDIGERFDRIVGKGTANSTSITN
ncbi:DUF5103 domain-containing protein [Gangjinia marincola]|uniref:DUF5103 domain-containing protein n=2 Tax=Gangjinia marincola TaxID=578463 RepID=A0ABP3XXW9_9FLAO